MSNLKYILCSPVVILLGLLILIFGGSSALGIVWLRSQINQTAVHIKKQEHDLVVLERKIREANSKIAVMHQPYKLKEKLSEDFRPTQASQVYVVTERSDGMMVAKKMVPDRGEKAKNIVLVGGRRANLGK
jgi:hypothetical protein